MAGLDLAPVKGARTARRRLALRLAWRDVRRHKGRSALIMALIALPILGLSFAATVGMSMVATPAETAAMELGATQARLTPMSAHDATAFQGVRGDIGGAGGWGGDGVDDPSFVPTAPADAVPAGYRAIPWQSVTLTSPVGQANVRLDAVVTDALNPAFTGKYTLLQGRAPAAPGEALGTPGLLDRFGLHLGGTLTTSAGDFAIVGTLRVENQGDATPALFVRSDQLPAAVMASASPVTPYLVGERPLTWGDARALNAKGVMATSRDLILHPPSDAVLGEAAQYSKEGRNGTMAGYAAMGALIGVLALLEVGLLAGAAFAVGARKRQRELALLAATGADGGMLRSVVTAGGLWLGLAGGLAGAVVGTAGATAAVVLGRDRGLALFPGLHLMWLVAAGLALVGAASGLAAALVPARAVARAATLAALKSGRTAQAPGRWGPRIGAGLLVLAVLALAGSAALSLVVRGTARSQELFNVVAGLAIAGAVLMVAGLVFLTGRMVVVLTARTGWLPVPLRLAARDAVRNRTRTVPAVASVLAAATMAGAVMVGVASTTEKMNDEQQWKYNQNQTSLPLTYVKHGSPGKEGGAANASAPPTVEPVDAGGVTKVLKAQLGPDTQTWILHGVDQADSCSEDMGASALPSDCTDWALQEPPANRCKLAADYAPVDLDDWRCKGSMSQDLGTSGLPPIVVGGPAELGALLGRAPSSEALAALAGGGMVLTNRVFLADGGTATIISFSQSAGIGPEAIDGGGSYQRIVRKPVTAHTLPAVVDPPEKALSFYGVVSPETAAKLKLPVRPEYLLVSAPRRLNQAETDRLQSALAPFYGGYAYFYQEPGPDAAMGLILWLIVGAGALITLSAAGITAGLALADGVEDQATLAAIGADTRIRKAISAAQTLLTALLGAVLGVVAGAIPVIVVLALQRGFPVVVPWAQMLALALLVPLVGGAAAWLLTRARLPMAGRRTLA